jgi:hypothetical protein
MRDSTRDRLQTYARASLVVLGLDLLVFPIFAMLMTEARQTCLALFEETAISLPFLTALFIDITPVFPIVAGIALLIGLGVKEFFVASPGVNLLINIAGGALQLGYTLLFMIAMFAGQAALVRGL